MVLYGGGTGWDGVWFGALCNFGIPPVFEGGLIDFFRGKIICCISLTEIIIEVFP